MKGELCSQSSFELDGFKFICTCWACPEQYDIYQDGHQVGYFYLRWGTLRVDTPAFRGKTILKLYPKGEGQLLEEERDEIMKQVVEALHKELDNDH